MIALRRTGTASISFRHCSGVMPRQIFVISLFKPNLVLMAPFFWRNFSSMIAHGTSEGYKSSIFAAWTLVLMRFLKRFFTVSSAWSVRWIEAPSSCHTTRLNAAPGNNSFTAGSTYSVNNRPYLVPCEMFNCCLLLCQSSFSCVFILSFLRE